MAHQCSWTYWMCKESRGNTTKQALQQVKDKANPCKNCTPSDAKLSTTQACFESDTTLLFEAPTSRQWCSIWRWRVETDCSSACDWVDTSEWKLFIPWFSFVRESSQAGCKIKTASRQSLSSEIFIKTKCLVHSWLLLDECTSYQGPY